MIRGSCFKTKSSDRVQPFARLESGLTGRMPTWGWEALQTWLRAVPVVERGKVDFLLLVNYKTPKPHVLIKAEGETIVFCVAGPVGPVSRARWAPQAPRAVETAEPVGPVGPVGASRAVETAEPVGPVGAPLAVETAEPVGPIGPLGPCPLLPIQEDGSCAFESHG